MLAVILLFIDGVGLGEESDHNPWYVRPTPHIDRLLGGRSLVRSAVGQIGSDMVLLETDASLGVPGLPQSATGQATIFTGRNAPKAMGAHQSGLPFQRLRKWVQADNIYLQMERQGWRATFLNCYTPEYFQRPATRRGWVSVSTAALLSSREPVRMLSDLLAGKGVYHDLTRWTLARTIPDVPVIEPETAADHLLDVARQYDLVIHEYFLSDLAGHKQNEELMQTVIDHYDRWLGALVDRKQTDDVIVLVSDHGNSEDIRVSTHTNNPVPTWIIGDAHTWREIPHQKWDLTCIVPLLLRLVEKRRITTS
ncbi:metalloenzyme [Polycladomyces abyssicola]|uniref:Metalloenzyme n=1 Tax=Polycladomyces abyssicola TaxID=1125966 RepID=A0A8D5UGM8_9BACL|nr:hypothetical protein [Polycladomyces abyssicola]BCU83052.1 metalloenzyme [Polycladomyces abyssicola]